MAFIDPEIQIHLDRIRAAAFNSYDLGAVVRYIKEKTYLNGARFSFKDHEFQEDILNDTHPDIVVQKCAQIGMSEAMARYAIAITRIMPYFSTIMTMPGSGDCEDFFKTRIDPIIDGSPDLRDQLDPALDNASIKGIASGLLYGRGTRGSTAALSVPADMLIHDEVDRSDAARLGQYQSRIIHSKWKLTRRFGTPTHAGIGIALAMQTANRYHHMCKCHHCNFQFVPNYHDHVVVPGWTREKKEITKDNLQTLRWDEAYLACPKCGQAPSLQPDRREWVCENPNDRLTSKGYYIIPFSAPNVITIPDLVAASTTFGSWGEFQNQRLGEVVNEVGESLTEDDINGTKYANGSLVSGDLHCMGVDMGVVCYFVIARMSNDGILVVVHRERCSIADLRATITKLMGQFRVLISVYDWQPYTESVLDLQKKDKNVYGARYSQVKTLAAYKPITAEEMLKEGKLGIQMIEINRNVHFDGVMGLFHSKKIVWAPMNKDDDRLWVSHILDMKRVQIADQYGEMSYTWVKSTSKQDHFMHALGYAWAACQLMPTASIDFPLGLTRIARKVKVATKQETQAYGAMR